MNDAHIGEKMRETSKYSNTFYEEGGHMYTDLSNAFIKTLELLKKKKKASQFIDIYQLLTMQSK